MQIVELSDYTMVIMKDSEDSPWLSVGKIHRIATKQKRDLWVRQQEHPYDIMKASDFVCSSGRLVLFFKERINPTFYLHERVTVDAV